MTKARDIADFKFENIVDTGTEGTRVATGTNAQRGSTAGQIRFNSDTGLAEYYTGTAFKAIDAPPTVSSVGNTNIEEASIASGFDLTISGSGFGSGATVKFIGNDGTEYNSPTVTVNSDTSITATVNTLLTNANEPYDVKVTNVSGLANTLADAFNVDGKPAWQTASGTLATIQDNATGTHATVSATDPEGDAVSYSETGGTVLSTNNFSLNSSSGAISGDPVDVSGATTHTFTLRATSGTNTADRSFNIIVNPTLDGTTSGRAFSSISTFNSLGTLSSAGYYDKYVTLNGAVSAYQQKLYYDGTDTWYVVSPQFTSGGLISNSMYGVANDRASDGSFKTIWQQHNRSVSWNGTWSYLGTTTVQDLIGTGKNNVGSTGAVPLGDSSSQVLTSLASLTSFSTINYYDHVAGSNYSSATLTALRNVVTELNYKTAWMSITGDDDGSGFNNYGGIGWDDGSILNNPSFNGTPATTHIKNASGSIQKGMAGQTNDNEAMGVTLWTHNAGLAKASVGTGGNSNFNTFSNAGSGSYTGGLKTTGHILPAEIAGETGGSSTVVTSPLYNSTIGKLNSKLVLLVK